ncbi:GDP-mannose 4,6-dehydratase [Candidatus Falkowbacteria bacterium]|nr:GDP-mannose 4,6-dehydratase [Candidatus Falkowbacteria bacterium]
MSKRAIFDKKNVLVTGGAGFIGSHLCDELVKTCKVICLDNFSSGDEKNIDHLLAEPNFEFVRHDIAELIDLENLPELAKFKIEFQGIQEIYHLACPTSPKDFERNKTATLSANSAGMKNSLDLAVKYGAKFMHFSSSVVYGPRREKNIKIRENDLGQVDMLSERGCYDEGKRFAETMAATYRQVHKIDAKIIRLFRTYGPRMKLDVGHMIPDFISNALSNKDLVVLGDKNFSSSFCYVNDVIDAAVKMMETGLNGPLNIGSDMDINIIEVAEKIIAALGSKSKIAYGEKMIFMTPLCLPDISRAREELGWMPVVTLEKGLEKTIDDLRAAKGLLGVKEGL